ncbi:MAG: hypothetical protein Q8S57_04435 [Methanoregula sp.]|nr:hypothetical protein [Methanoregula sp.]
MASHPQSNALKDLVVFIIVLAVMATMIVGFILLSYTSLLPVSQPDYDIIIRGGTVYDGSLNVPTMADIGIKGDKISAVGNLAGRTAKKVIDAHDSCSRSFQGIYSVGLLRIEIKYPLITMESG